MRTSALTIALLLSVSLTGACSRHETSVNASSGSTAAVATKAPVSLTPEQLGELGALMRKNPSRADDLLTQHGQTRESFEKAIRDVTEKPDASRRYADSYRRALGSN